MNKYTKYLINDTAFCLVKDLPIYDKKIYKQMI